MWLFYKDAYSLPRDTPRSGLVALWPRRPHPDKGLLGPTGGRPRGGAGLIKDHLEAPVWPWTKCYPGISIWLQMVKVWPCLSIV